MRAVQNFFKKQSETYKKAVIPYDLVVIDLEMPEINGIEISRLIKEKKNGTKIIIMTGRSVQVCMELMAQALVDGWLLKPFGINELQTMLVEVGCLTTETQ